MEYRFRGLHQSKCGAIEGLTPVWKGDITKQRSFGMYEQTLARKLRVYEIEEDDEYVLAWYEGEVCKGAVEKSKQDMQVIAVDVFNHGKFTLDLEAARPWIHSSQATFSLTQRNQFIDQFAGRHIVINWPTPDTTPVLNVWLKSDIFVFSVNSKTATKTVQEVNTMLDDIVETLSEKFKFQLLDVTFDFTPNDAYDLLYTLNSAFKGNDKEKNESRIRIISIKLAYANEKMKECARALLDSKLTENERQGCFIKLSEQFNVSGGNAATVVDNDEPDVALFLERLPKHYDRYTMKSQCPSDYPEQQQCTLQDRQSHL